MSAYGAVCALFQTVRALLASLGVPLVTASGVTTQLGVGLLRPLYRLLCPPRPIPAWKLTGKMLQSILLTVEVKSR